MDPNVARQTLKPVPARIRTQPAFRKPAVSLAREIK
jgi:hypothetical protein